MNSKLYGVLIWLCCLPIVASAKDATHFDYPLGYPSGVGYTSIRQDDPMKPNKPSYLDQIFISNECGVISHPGEDWNDDNRGKDYGNDSDDAGDPVSAIADGVVADVQYLASSDGMNDVGYAIQVSHTGHFFVPRKEDANQYTIYHSSESISNIWSVYIHLASIGINPRQNRSWITGDEISAGETIGSVGDFPHGSNTNYHLHFEIRKELRESKYLPCKYNDEVFDDIYVSPSNFIRLNRCVPPSVPPPNYELPNACMGESCMYTPASGFQWEALQDTPVFPRRDINSQPFTSILTGEKFTAETGILVTKTAGFVKISFDWMRDCQSIGLEDGECVSVLAPWSEGYYYLWDQDRFIGGCGISGPDIEPVVDWWVYARKSNGQTGWILYRHGFNFCYSQPRYEERPECLD